MRLWDSIVNRRRCQATEPGTDVRCTRRPHDDDDHHHSNGGGTITAEWGSVVEARRRRAFGWDA